MYIDIIIYGTQCSAGPHIMPTCLHNIVLYGYNWGCGPVQIIAILDKEELQQYLQYKLLYSNAE